MSSDFVSRGEFERFKADIAHQLAHLMDDEWDCGDKACPYNLSGEPDFEEDADWPRGVGPSGGG